MVRELVDRLGVISVPVDTKYISETPFRAIANGVKKIASVSTFNAQ